MIMTFIGLAQSSETIQFTGVAWGNLLIKLAHLFLYQAEECFPSSAYGSRATQGQQRAEERTEETDLWEDAKVSEEQTSRLFHR